MPLTNKRKVFVAEYLRCWNASEAARRAEYAKPGAEGHRLLKNAEVQAHIQERMTDLAMSADECLSRLAEEARADIAEFIHEDGSLNWETLRSKGHLVKKIRHTDDRTEIELYSVQSALQLIGQHHALFVERQQRELEISLSDRLSGQIDNALARGYDEPD